METKGRKRRKGEATRKEKRAGGEGKERRRCEGTRGRAEKAKGRKAEAAPRAGRGRGVSGDEEGCGAGGWDRVLRLFSLFFGVGGGSPPR